MSIEAPNKPPQAKQVPAERTYHGDTVTDEYAWLADRADPDTIAYLEAENAYTEAATAALAPLADQIFAEIKARTQESDLVALTGRSKGGGWHYGHARSRASSTAVHCRRAVRARARSSRRSPRTASRWTARRCCSTATRSRPGTTSSPSARAFRTSPGPERWLAYFHPDFSGNERFTIRIKDLATGQLLPDEIPNTYAGCAWSLDGSVLFYTTVDDAWRPYRVWRHHIGTPAAQDTIVFEEPDERFHVYIYLTRSERYLLIKAASVLTT